MGKVKGKYQASKHQGWVVVVGIRVLLLCFHLSHQPNRENLLHQGMRTLLMYLLCSPPPPHFLLSRARYFCSGEGTFATYSRSSPSCASLHGHLSFCWPACYFLEPPMPASFLRYNAFRMTRVIVVYYFASQLVVRVCFLLSLLEWRRWWQHQVVISHREGEGKGELFAEAQPGLQR